jgi:hypothetical protein
MPTLKQHNARLLIEQEGNCAGISCADCPISIRHCAGDDGRQDSVLVHMAVDYLFSQLEEDVA